MHLTSGYRVLRRLPAADGTRRHLVADPRAPDAPPLVLVLPSAGSPAARVDAHIAVLSALEGHPLAAHVLRLLDVVPSDGEGVGLVVEHLPDRLGPTDAHGLDARVAAVDRIAAVVAALHGAGWTHGAITPGAIAWRGEVPVLVDLAAAEPATLEAVRADRAALRATAAAVRGAAGTVIDPRPFDDAPAPALAPARPDGAAEVVPPRADSARRTARALPIPLPSPRRARGGQPAPSPGRARASAPASAPAHSARHVRRPAAQGRAAAGGGPARLRLRWALLAVMAAGLVLVGAAMLLPGEAEAVVSAGAGEAAGTPTLGPLPTEPLAAVDALLHHRSSCAGDPSCLATTTQEGSPARAADDAGAAEMPGEGPSVLLDDSGGVVVVERPGAIVIAMDTRAGWRLRAVLPQRG